MCSEPEKEPSQDEALKRLKKKSKEIKSKNVVPPVDDEEPSGRLSGGPDSLDLSDDED
ncbi:hypothetical protein [Microbulbifer halophilus]|uniref:Uncharacterized protein n=1 Tax=Microbulbifer halophilus TaxID=453963 RepID=A0ABW5E818_9GAMM|nr:hypothetical protein [Microbulbifer halophilus]MCW8125530.1 hypothetical protein [Microbulbifer halophilus]